MQSIKLTKVKIAKISKDDMWTGWHYNSNSSGKINLDISNIIGFRRSDDTYPPFTHILVIDMQHVLIEDHMPGNRIYEIVGDHVVIHVLETIEEIKDKMLKAYGHKWIKVDNFILDLFRTLQLERVYDD